MSTTINAGRVRFVSRGTYNNSTQYYLFDLVDYNGSSYIAKENSLGNLPTNTQYWQLIAEKGNTGNTGATGPTGATGNGIQSITKTGTSGLVDTYTITYTNGTTTTFDITNGEDGEVTQAQFDDLQQRVEDAENNQLTNTPEKATSHYLQDSADSRFRRFIPIGRTTQESTTGDNLISSENIDTTIAGVTYKSQNDGTILANGTKYGGGFANFSNNTVQLEPGEYSATCFLISGTTSKSVTVYLYNPNNPINISELGRTGKSFEIAEVGTYYLRFGVWTDGTVFTNAKIGFMLVKGSTIPDEFERFTGGEPAPNPKYPFPIKNTGDNGSVNEKIENKNLFDKSKATNGRYVKNSDGTLGYSDTLSASDFIEVKANITYYQSNVNNYYSCLYDKGKNFIRQINSNSFTPTVDGYMRTSFLTTNIDIVQIEQGSTASDYVPHSEQNISFPLAEGQKFMEGSYPDDDEKVHHKMKEVDLSTLTYTQYATNKYRSNIINNIKIPATQSTIPNMFAEKYRPRMQNGTFENGEIGITQNGEIILCDTTGTPSGIIQYELAEEQTEDFTEEQKTAYPEWKKARTYKNVTHISSEDETPANVEVEYVRDLETVINNLSN